MSSAAPLMPLNIATDAMITHTGSVNQYTVRSTATPAPRVGPVPVV